MRQAAEERRRAQATTPSGFVERYIGQPPGAEINRFCWAPDGRSLACPTVAGDIVLCAEQGVQTLTRPRPDTSLTQPLVAGPALAATWSPDGRFVHSCSLNGTITLWDVTHGVLAKEIPIHSDWVASIACNPHDGRIASGSRDHTVKVWRDEGQEESRLSEHESAVTQVVWSPNGTHLASSSLDGNVFVWNCQGNAPTVRIETQTGYVLCVCWDNMAEALVTGSSDCTVRIWDAKRGAQLRVLQGHTAPVVALSLSCDGRLLASASTDSSIRIWRCDTWEEVAALNQGSTSRMFTAVSFHPFEPLLALPGAVSGSIRTLEYDFDQLVRKSRSQGVRYRNAKVVLVGDSGVGKSGLGLVLAGHAFRPTESTAGRRVWAIDRSEVHDSSEVEELRETFLWDLPGQVGHRLVNQIHLQEVAVALVVFDPHAEHDPFSGVRHWIRALRQTQAREASWMHSLELILVAARCDASGAPASRGAIELVQKELGLSKYFETSAREGWAIAGLRQAIKDAIDWTRLPVISSSSRFYSVRRYLSSVRREGSLLIGLSELYDRYVRSVELGAEERASREEFVLSVRQLGTRGIVYNFGFSNLVLMAPEYLDYYASAVVLAARDEPTGMGSVLERDITEARLRLATSHRFPHPDGEKLLLIATVETLLQNEVALRESTEQGDIIVFPAQFRHDRSDALPSEQRTVCIRFEGPILKIYASLVVRLTRSQFYRKSELWRNGALFNVETGGTCGLVLVEDERGSAELHLFFGPATSTDMRLAFEYYVTRHLNRSAVAGSISRRQICRCPHCALELTESQVERLRQRGLSTAVCMECQGTIPLTDRPPTTEGGMNFIAEIDLVADRARKYATRLSQVQGRKALKQYDIFLSYNRQDKEGVQRVARFLQKRGIATWLDVEDMPAGVSWQQELEQIIGTLRCAAIFCGPNGLGSWQTMEVEALLQHFAGTDRRLIPVILPGTEKPDFPLFVRSRSWIDLREPGQNKRLLAEVRAGLGARRSNQVHESEPEPPVPRTAL